MAINNDKIELLKIINSQEEALTLKAIESKTAMILQVRKCLRGLKKNL